jgi:hypothetical protein
MKTLWNKCKDWVAITGLMAVSYGFDKFLMGLMDAPEGTGLAIWGAIIGAVISAGASYMGSKGGDAPAYQGVDIPALQRLAQITARENAINSMALEQDLTPETAALRTQSIQQLLGALAPNQETNRQANIGQQELLRLLGADVGQLSVPELQGSQLQQEAFQRALADLQSGGALPQDVRNEITRNAQVSAGRSGVLGGQAGRDITARDLGIGSMNLRQQRLGQAAQLGAQEYGQNVQQQNLASMINQANAQIQAGNTNRRLGIADMMLGNEAQQYGRLFQTANLAQGINRPVTGLDPGQIASIAVGDQNNLNASNQQAAAIAAQRNANQWNALSQFGGSIYDLYGGGRG